MKAEELNLLGRVLDRSPVLALGVIVEGRPYVGQLPFALWVDRSAFLIHVSALARHSQGLAQGAPFSALIGGEGDDPFQIPRLTVEGEVQRLERGSPEYAEAEAVFLGRLPSARGHFQLGDFSLIALQVRKARFVAGFARAYNLTASHLREAVDDSQAG